jgi:hypothetical protein
MEYFTKQDSIVRQIWGKSDTIMFIFAGAAAEFALNKEVDWLYYTGKLPNDPLGRLFSTVAYARAIVFAEKDAALKAIDTIKGIHSAVESKRGAVIPDRAYRDVLFMLIDYSIRAYELLERKLTDADKRETFDVFYRVGSRMGISGLPETLEGFEIMRERQIGTNMVYSQFTADLFRQYRKHLGLVRYQILLEAQILVAPKKVLVMLGMWRWSLLVPVIFVYKIFRLARLDWLLKELILPKQYKNEIKSLDVPVG